MNFAYIPGADMGDQQIVPTNSDSFAPINTRIDRTINFENDYKARLKSYEILNEPIKNDQEIIEEESEEERKEREELQKINEIIKSLNLKEKLDKILEKEELIASQTEIIKSTSELLNKNLDLFTSSKLIEIIHNSKDICDKETKNLKNLKDKYWKIHKILDIKKSAFNEQIYCSICMEYGAPFMMNCGHICCKPCEKKLDKKCFVCRNKYTEFKIFY